ncbi:Stk1 family PASTA domain-containing Ser/Thr kinase [Actinotalea sp. K2]|uniref:Stk1 family PASTA domain-containing Ser/Thr kinase n=1 Tax=Actinotalea sp. K2 TaxID=2939438 RepID=UPI002017B667|nr:Stk1 family PASTA domain-containing Ser/Thr kinase [Actinotalea sp. K2]MCL3862176.1 Stk1 family PASTA domain-containing Ser/Thr kinase [Actinotalea sp. K2]
MAATLTDPLIGHLVDGRYEVLSRIARGGMATVYLAVDRRLDREVALKVMHAHLAEGGAGSEFIARFRREARAAARLTHPGLVGVFDQGVDGETSYLTMEFIDGVNLRRHLGERGSLTLGEAFSTAESILDALAAAHRVGLVHRDVKPENVLLATDGRVKVADFGLARAVTEVTSTTTGTVLGTVAYLSPELVAHGTSDARTDVYAVGILLYEMITGRQPFTGATPIQVAYQHVNSDIPDASAAVEWLPVEVDELVGALAARDPSDRPADAGSALEVVRRTRATLDAATLARRADVAPTLSVATDTNGSAEPQVEDGTGTSDGPDDPDATAALGVRHPRTDPDDDRPGRTVALKIGSGMGDSDQEQPTPIPRPRTRRRLWVLIALLLATVVGLGLGARWYVTAGPGAYTQVPVGLVGAELATAQDALTAAELDGDVREVFDPVIAQGLVVEVSPGEGERIARDGTVELAVSQGPDMRRIPTDLLGKPVADVTTALEEAGFLVPEPELVYSDDVAADAVIAVSQQAGTELPVNSEVRLTVSRGPAPVRIITVVGVDRDTAVAQLQADGLVVDVQEQHSTEVATGLVVSQSPEPGTDGLRGDTVTIVVSSGPPPVEVPNVRGMGEGQAVEVLEGAGLAVDVRYGLFGQLFGSRVVSQEPSSGETVPLGSTVAITVS